MKPILIAGTVIVNFALISYAIGVITEQRTHRATRRVRLFLTIGVVLDVAATTCMIIGSTKSPFTLHGMLGYSSLLAMTLDTALVWRHYSKAGESLVPNWLHLYSRYAYLWWIAAYVTGAALVFLAR